MLDACIIPVLKPPGMTSHDVVQAVRRSLGVKKIGHTGTLDPLAAGVMVLVVGRATRAASYFTQLDKAYTAHVVFGLRTDSGDVAGELLSRTVPDLDVEHILRVMPRFIGEIKQRPPLTSAVKVGGRRLYERARAGEHIEAPLRTVRIDALRLLDWWPAANPNALPQARFEIVCSSGTYIRSLVDDLGAVLGCGAVTDFLLRHRVGPFQAGDAVPYDQVTPERLTAFAHPMADALSFLPAVTVTAAEARRIAYGQRVTPNQVAFPPDQPVRLMDETQRLLAVARLRQGPNGPYWRYDAVFYRPEEVAR